MLQTSLLSPINNLFYHHLEIRMVATSSTQWEAWSGAILRNNLLKAANQVIVNDKVNLLELIDHFPLTEIHPMYKELKEGFPKGYVIALPEEYLVAHSELSPKIFGQKKRTILENTQEGLYLKEGEIFKFSLFLIGNMSSYYQHFIHAIQLMCQQGMGHPQVPFSLIDICEKSYDGKLHLLTTGNNDQIKSLIYPIIFSDYQSFSENKHKTRIEITFLTPVVLFKQTMRKNPTLSYQDKSNGFPSFYQLVRSAVARILKLTMLYISPEKTDIDELSLAYFEDWINYATHASLVLVDMYKTTLKNTSKKESANKMPLSGYIGKQIYEGYFNQFLPMLKFMEALGVGNETVYGLGRYLIKTDN